MATTVSFQPNAKYDQAGLMVRAAPWGGGGRGGIGGLSPPLDLHHMWPCQRRRLYL
jgi:hypothetical protein